mmetsp:Transcript_67653/g.187520  ORF Transcript_67653/g.187520 Transcript_67653/m.187520 type:complete len:223 (-) Transcript_67653:612-1280(-)
MRAAAKCRPEPWHRNNLRKPIGTHGRAPLARARANSSPAQRAQRTPAPPRATRRPRAPHNPASQGAPAVAPEASPPGAQAIGFNKLNPLLPYARIRRSLACTPPPGCMSPPVGGGSCRPPCPCCPSACGPGSCAGANPAGSAPGFGAKPKPMPGSMWPKKWGSAEAYVAPPAWASPPISCTFCCCCCCCICCCMCICCCCSNCCCCCCGGGGGGATEQGPGV